MKDSAIQIFSDFAVSWDPEVITKDFIEVYTPNRAIYDPIDGKSYWQKFPNNILFARNFYNNCTAECIEVVERLRVIQESMSVEGNHLINIFKNHKLSPKKVNLIKTVPGTDVGLHQDITRTICLNIGLKNSNKWETQISNSNNIKDFNISHKHSFTMNDGDGYLLHINNPHQVVCLTKNDLGSQRFIISYTLY